ncbi:hypothetical protein SADUNF_Sadunf07G0089400 [Salix dunnii]|uniref:Uncharacterized protein n=1 Tax=Salix dunnii TaxID=1413687 RepID=A0A835K077_9ROSI|nr:hypothetical protein SADUNF_Sadunf07G0089400 [Salix dunnii]
MDRPTLYNQLFLFLNFLQKNSYLSTKEMSDPNKDLGHGYPSTSFAGLPQPRWRIKWKIIVEALQFYPSCSSPSEKKV